MRVKMKGGNRSEEKRFIVKKLEDGHQRNVTRKRREKWQITIKKRKWGKKNMNQIYVMPCESQKSSAPHFICLRRSHRTTVPNSLIHHVCSIIGHAKTKNEIKTGEEK